MSFWLPPRAPWSLGPGLRRENEGEESGGPGAAMVPLPQNGPQRSGFSAGTVFEFIPLSFPPRKRGPRSRDDAAATERTSAHWALRRHDARGLLKRKGKRKRWLFGSSHPPSWYHVLMVDRSTPELSASAKSGCPYPLVFLSNGETFAVAAFFLCFVV